MEHAESAWRSFRRYRHKGIRITEADGHIVFRQKNLIARWRLVVFILLSLAVMAGTVVYSFRQPFSETGFIVPGIGLFVYLFIIAPILFRVFVRRPTVIDVQWGIVTIYRNRDVFVVPENEIKALEVRRETTGEYFVLVWHGSVPIYTLSSMDEANAITLREGVMAAIRMVNSPPGAAPVPVEAAPPPPRRKTFEE